MRVVGDVDHLDEVAGIFDGLSPKVIAKGTTHLRQHMLQDVIVVRLGEWSAASLEEHDEAERKYLLPTAALIHRLAPRLKAIDRSRCEVELYLSTTREEETGGFGLPAELVAAAAEAGLSINVSIMVIFAIDSGDDDHGDAEGEVPPGAPLTAARTK